jgi:hypothetical protein
MTSPTLIPFTGPVELVTLSTKLPALFLPDAKASERFWEFFAANIRNKNTRGGPTTRQRAGFPTGARVADCSIWRR